MTSSAVHVAVAVIVNQDNEALISLRSTSSHQGGLWEFPGGKLEPGETVEAALRREILEELDIQVLDSIPFKVIEHHYPDKKVVLHIHIVKNFSGEPKGIEGQKITWKPLHLLNPEKFPAANRYLINALNLPDKFMITGSFNGREHFLSSLKNSLTKGIKLVQLRCKDIESEEYLSLVKDAQALCVAHNSSLLLNTDIETFNKTQAQGLHLNSQRLHSIKERPINSEKLLSVSCHTKEDLLQAQLIGADIVLLSPVKETTSHPGVKGIGWEMFSRLIVNLNIPVYALGGMSEGDISSAKNHGAQGVAAISSFWMNHE